MSSGPLEAAREPRLRFERLIAAAPERVFDAFTDPVGQDEFYG